MLQALSGNVTAGLDAAARSAAYLPDSKGLLNTPEHVFWSAILQAMNPSGGRTAVKTVMTAKKSFARWATRCPVNFALRCELLAADAARLRKQPDEAMHHYQCAIGLGETNRTLHLLGLANQRAGLLAFSQGRDEAAQQFARDAQRAYSQWGATSIESIPGKLVERTSALTST